MNLLLNVQRRGGGDEGRPVPVVFPAPGKLWVEVAVAALIRHLNRRLALLLDQRLVLGGRDVLPRRLVVLQRLHLLQRLALALCHRMRVPQTSGATAAALARAIASSIISLKCFSTFAANSNWIVQTSVNSANAHRPQSRRLFTPGIQ